MNPNVNVQKIVLELLTSTFAPILSSVHYFFRKMLCLYLVDCPFVVHLYQAAYDQQYKPVYQEREDKKKKNRIRLSKFKYNKKM